MIAGMYLALRLRIYTWSSESKCYNCHAYVHRIYITSRFRLCTRNPATNIHHLVYHFQQPQTPFIRRDPFSRRLFNPNK